MNIKVTFQENNLDMSVQEKDIFDVDFGGGGGGTTDYARLNNKPSINDVTLEGNKTAAQLQLASQADIEDLEYYIGSRLGSQLERILSAEHEIEQTKTALDGKATAITKTNGADFYDGADMPIKSLVVNIEMSQSGEGTPSPTNVRPISGHTGLTVYQTGKNRFDYNYWYDNAQSVSGSSVSRTTITLEPNTVYTVSSNAAQTSKNSKVFAWSGGITDGSPATATTGIGELYTRQITTDADGQLTVGMYLDSSNPSYIPRSEFEDGTIWIQIEKGSTKTDHEPYAGDQIEVTFPAEAGTVYGGTIDVISGKLSVDKAIVDLGTLTWTKSSNRAFMYSNGIANVIARPSSQDIVIDGLCSVLPCKTSNLVGQESQGIGVHTNGNIRVYYDGIPSNADAFKTEVSGWMFLYPLVTPVEYQLTPQKINSLLGENHITADVGGIKSVIYCVDTTLAIDSCIETSESIMATVEDNKASKNYEVGSYLIMNDTLYEVTAQIASGATITVGTNVVKTTIADELYNLKQALLQQ